LFIADIKKEHLAVKEAKILGIPVFALVDTNCDPEEVDYPIPCNDDSNQAIDLIAKVLADAVIEGKTIAKAKRAEKKAESERISKEKEGQKERQPKIKRKLRERKTKSDAKTIAKPKKDDAKVENKDDNKSQETKSEENK